MMRRLRHRCWVVTYYREPTVRHHRTDQAAYREGADRMLDFWQQWPTIDGADWDAAFPYHDLQQLDHPCWIIECDGCRRRALNEHGNDHLLSPANCSLMAVRAGWDVELNLCAECRQLVAPLRPSNRRSLVGVPSAG